MGTSGGKTYLITDILLLNVVHFAHASFCFLSLSTSCSRGSGCPLVGLAVVWLLCLLRLSLKSSEGYPSCLVAGYLYVAG